MMGLIPSYTAEMIAIERAGKLKGLPRNPRNNSEINPANIQFRVFPWIPWQTV